jgi:hypothetical protein
VNLGVFGVLVVRFLEAHHQDTKNAKDTKAIGRGLWLLCDQCNQKKKDAHPETAHVFLDFLNRPVPSDAYSELIW